jgi:hypothetical protein
MKVNSDSIHDSWVPEVPKKTLLSGRIKRVGWRAGRSCHSWKLLRFFLRNSKTPAIFSPGGLGKSVKSPALTPF